jgi:murein DD-endopeptidase MepM/ murein hydrolase activator NlpD
MGAVGAVLLGTGVTAFGIAPLAPDAAYLPVSQVVEALTFPAPALPVRVKGAMTLFHTDTVRRDDTVQSLLQRLGVHDHGALLWLRGSSDAQSLFEGRAGKTVTVETTDDHQFRRLTARWIPDEGRTFVRLVIEVTPEGFTTRRETGELTAQTRVASGVISSTLFAASDAAGLPDSVAVQMAEIFSNEIDFRRDLREGDRFTVAFESLEADGETLRPGRVLSAEFVNNGHAHEAVWFEEPGARGAYFDFNGRSARKSFLGSPLEFSRVSSGYGMRFHPISGVQKPHLGVDYAAPTGTPVRTIADGVVAFAGVQRGYGQVIEILHRDNKSTLFAHLSRIDVRQGQKVHQGEFIGAVGSTGLSTGPHLHFEFRDNGVHQDPLEVARQSESVPVSPESKERFEAVARLQRSHLLAAATIRQASAE